MFGFLKKKFGKSVDEARPAEQAAEEQTASEVRAEDLAGAPAPQAPAEASVAEAARRDAAEIDATAEPVEPAALPESPAQPAAEAAALAEPEPAAQAPAEAVPEPQPEPPGESTPEAPVAVEPAIEAEPEAEPEPEPEPSAAAAVAKKSWTERLKAGLARTRNQIGGGLASLFGLRKIDEDLLEELESTLLMADCGVDATQHLIDDLRRRWKRDRLETADQLQKALADGLHEIIAPLEAPLEVAGHRPFIIMIAGVNGSGKTTSIGKLAKYFQAHGKSVLLAAGDTFRAAAREQLMTWGERNNVTVVAQDSGDAAAVIFDAINAARARKIDVVLADTAGRLPTQLHLMEEIAKVRRVIAKADPSGPHEVLLVLDANIGQNALAQVKAFDKAIGVTGLVVTKLDGTAKGGVLAAIARQCPKPLRFIGVGEGIDDLQPFKAREFVDALFEPGAGAVKAGAEARR
ncbi:signal recognition particle-docking protein FtsY [Thauera aminoaromatica]|uniref:Signal recognition particle receptor FtsY n=2 Tax=Thauera aminoaromatica TaxID=164330 RepID=C4KDP3_THASP|nr:signal recognition particle-docking protein FtsY [Thauera aminoaromatica]ACR02209.1 signal recognition particle-docking protein FtsY [Thauera aminoaromatica]